MEADSNDFYVRRTVLRDFYKGVFIAQIRLNQISVVLE